ncbi:MAG: DNA repair protein RecO [candidate division Zixibacteria bacterium]|nr:DNA repair protein RecO [candidate division Zixibacteria bacterium]
MARKQINGFVIRGFSMGESSRVITLFTGENGKLKCVAKGARKSATKKGGALELFSLVRCNIYLKENVELGTIGSVDMIDDYSAIAADPAKFGFASAFCEILDKSTSIDQPIIELFDLTAEFFSHIMKSPGQNSAPLFWAAFIKTLAILGYQPRLYECVVCGKKNEDRAAFYDSQKGGIICSDDVLEHVQYGKLSKTSLRILQDFLSRPLSEIVNIECTQKNLGEIEQFILSFADYHSGLRRNLKSFKFLSQLK